MAEGGKMLSATWPTPPPFYKHFTTANLQRVREADEAAGRDDSTLSLSQSLLHETPDLSYLSPPIPPESGQYRCLGEQHDINAGPTRLSSRNIEQLYPDSLSQELVQVPLSAPGSAITQLTGLLRSLLLAFLSLTQTTSRDVSNANKHLEDLHLLFENTHQLLNELRPHQARQTLIEMMGERLKAGRKEVGEVRRLAGKVDVVAGKDGTDQAPSQLVTSKLQSSEETEVEQGLHKRKERERLIWEALMELEV
ncbi:MAG: Mediator of RNA polymerase II transcription subunit 7 [Chrysothrix sp. TS-e1954]|nr:MAG: Mediator of RNA polymerase II transcription subunit 7 [Chrysothrix sp. TS-e1954]